MFNFKKKTIKSLIESGDLKAILKITTIENCNEIDKDGHTPLYYAVQKEQIEIVRYLFKLGAIPALASSSDDTPIMEDVIRTFNKNILEIFIEHGECLPDRIDNLPVLHFVVSHKRFSCDFLMLLLNNGLDINNLDIHNLQQTALAYLIGLDNFSLQAFRALLDNGADVNYAIGFEYSPLARALKNSSLSKPSSVRDFNFANVLSLLQNYNLDMNYHVKAREDGRKESLIMTLLLCNEIDSFLLLLENGFKLSDNNIADYNISLYFGFYNAQQIARLIKVNIEYQLNLPIPFTLFSKDEQEIMINNLSDEDPQATLWFQEIVMLQNLRFERKIAHLTSLLNKGANINGIVRFCGYNITLLHDITCYDQILDCEKHIEWLVDNGAEIESHGTSALLCSIWFNKPKLVQYFANNGGDILFTEPSGMTAFSKLFTYSPGGSSYGSLEESLDMLLLIKNICTEQNKTFPLLEPFIFGLDADDLSCQFNLPTAIMWFYKEEEYLIPFLDLLMTCGWDVNHEFDYLLDRANILIHLLFLKDIDEKIIIHLLDKYPEINITTSGGNDNILNLVLSNNYSLETTRRFIDKVEDVNCIIHRRVEDKIIDIISGNYIEKVISLGKSTEATHKNWRYVVIKALLDAGCNPNTNNILTLKPEYTGDVMYRKETTILDSILNRHSMVVNDIEYGDCHLHIFKLLLDYGANPHKKTDRNDLTFLHTLTLHASILEKDMIKYLDELDNRNLLQIDNRTSDGSTVLFLAAFKCMPNLVQYLIAKGANISVIGGHNQNSILNVAIAGTKLAIPERRLEIVRMLLDAGADIECIDGDGRSPLMSAATFGCEGVVTELLSRGANVDSVEESGMTALHFAVRENYGHDLCWNHGDGMNEELKLRIIKLLVEKGADINLPHELEGTPLIDAMALGHKTIFKGLIELGVDVNAKSLNDERSVDDTPLGVAILLEDADYYNYLLEQGANINSSGKNGMTPLMTAIYYNLPDKFNDLIKRGADIHKLDPFKRNSLMIAARFGNMFFIESLLQYKELEITATDIYGRNVLFYVAQRLFEVRELDFLQTSSSEVEDETLHILKIMMEELSVPYIKDIKEETPLHHAAYNGLFKVVEYFIMQGFNINERSLSGLTTLMSAVSFHSSAHHENRDAKIATIKLLLDNGADVNKTALDIVNDYDNERDEELINMLEKYGDNKAKMKLGF